ncbi:RNA-directed DNA polymerase, eukaryota, partial [Tanacetum coccineum]
MGGVIPYKKRRDDACENLSAVLGESCTSVDNQEAPYKNSSVPPISSLSQPTAVELFGTELSKKEERSHALSPDVKKLMRASVMIDNSLSPSHLLLQINCVNHKVYADDAVFIGEWSRGNLSRVMHALHCFSLASGLKINVHKSHLLGVGIPNDTVAIVASDLGCSTMITPFKYLGVMVGENMAKVSAWDDVVRK